MIARARITMILWLLAMSVYQSLFEGELTWKSFYATLGLALFMVLYWHFRNAGREARVCFFILIIMCLTTLMAEVHADHDGSVIHGAFSYLQKNQVSV